MFITQMTPVQTPGVSPTQDSNTDMRLSSNRDVRHLSYLFQDYPEIEANIRKFIERDPTSISSGECEKLKSEIKKINEWIDNLLNLPKACDSSDAWDKINILCDMLRELKESVSSSIANVSIKDLFSQLESLEEKIALNGKSLEKRANHDRKHKSRSAFFTKLKNLVVSAFWGGLGSGLSNGISGEISGEIQKIL